MPTYDLRNKETGEVKEMILSISKKEEMVASGEWEQVHLASTTIVSDVGGLLSKADDGFKDLLKNIKKHSGRRNTIKV